MEYEGGRALPGPLSLALAARLNNLKKSKGHWKDVTLGVAFPKCCFFAKLKSFAPSFMQFCLHRLVRVLILLTVLGGQ